MFEVYLTILVVSSVFIGYKVGMCGSENMSQSEYMRGRHDVESEAYARGYSAGMEYTSN